MCSICGQNRCHFSCPNYSPVKTGLICSKCREDINVGEEYITNEYGDSRHYDCFLGTRELLQWLGYEIKIMEEDYERDYYMD